MRRTACRTCFAARRQTRRQIRRQARHRTPLGSATRPRIVARLGLAPADTASIADAISGGHLWIVRWLVAVGEAWTPWPASLLRDNAIRWACIGGHLRVARWYAARFCATAEEARAHSNWGLQSICQMGRLPAARWFVSRFALTPADARADNCIALRLACGAPQRAGRRAVALWLVCRFELTEGDAREGAQQLRQWQGEARAK